MPLAPSGFTGRRSLDVANVERRNLHRGWAQIVGEGAGEEIALLVVSKLLEQGGAESVREAAVHLALHDRAD